MIAPVVLTSSSTIGRLTPEGLKYQSWRPPSAPPDPQINPSSEITMSSNTVAMVVPPSVTEVAERHRVVDGDARRSPDSSSDREGWRCPAD
jgi:hypothetical protein